MAVHCINYKLVESDYLICVYDPTLSTATLIRLIVDCIYECG